MGTNNLLIAAAGSGKTSKIVDEALSVKSESVLITTFTEANEAGIRQKILKKTGGYIPKNITIQTWFSFLLQHGVRPYQGVMNEALWDRKIGFFLVSGSSSSFKGKDGKVYSRSKEKDFFHYYFISEENLKIYSDKVAEFVHDCNKKTDGVIIERISRVYKHIFIDEVQDLAGYDLEILKSFFESQSNILLVGDPRQGTYSTNNSRKNKKFKKTDIIYFFDDPKIRENLVVDDTSLAVNFRSNESICTFSNKLFPNLSGATSGQKDMTEHDGIFFIHTKDLEEYLKKFSPCMQLRWSISTTTTKGYSVMNFGESKGLDFDRVIIYPTKPMIEWIFDKSKELAPTTRCKFYVALTRAKYSVGIVYDYNEKSDLKEVQRYAAV